MKSFTYGKKFKGTKEQYLARMAKWLTKPTKGNKQRKSFRGFTEEVGYFWENNKPYAPNSNLSGTSSKGKLRDVTQTLRRKQKEDDQSGDNRIPMPVAKDKEAHHRRVLDIYQPFFEGLNKKEKKELANWFVEEGYATGNVAENFTMLRRKNHQAGIHSWLQRNKIQVPAGEEGWTNFARDSKTGKPLDFKYGPDGEMISKMPNFSHMGINERYFPIMMYLDYVQSEVEDMTDSFEIKDKLEDAGQNPNPASMSIDTAKILLGKNKIPNSSALTIGPSPSNALTVRTNQAVNILSAIPNAARRLSNAAQQFSQGDLNEGLINTFATVAETVPRNNIHGLAIGGSSELMARGLDYLDTHEGVKLGNLLSGNPFYNPFENYRTYDAYNQQNLDFQNRRKQQARIDELHKKAEEAQERNMEQKLEALEENRKLAGIGTIQ